MNNQQPEENREQYIEWCKQRARQYLERDQLQQAVTSMVSDMNKRDDCRVSNEEYRRGTIAVLDRDRNEIAKFIDKFQ